MPSKYFIVGLPRSGTTSACMYLLDLGFKVAHTAFTEAALDAADVVADTPVFVDYPLNIERFPEAKFIYLERPLDQWCPSIRRLLRSMRKQCARDRSVLQPEILRCFNAVFPKFETMLDFSDEYLVDCYQLHRAPLELAMLDFGDRFLTLDITNPNTGKILSEFCLGEGTRSDVSLPHVNRGRRITYWDDVDHPNKINSSL